jgi:hypothetical protein
LIEGEPKRCAGGVAVSMLPDCTLEMVRCINRMKIPMYNLKDDQSLINVLMLYSIQPTKLRVQVLKAILVLSESEFTGGQLLTHLQKEYAHFQYHTLFASLIVFSRKGLLEKRPQHNSRVGRPMLVFTIPVVVLKLFGTTDQEL